MYPNNEKIAPALILSIFLHLFLFTALSLNIKRDFIAPKVITISLDDSFESPKSQIVSPSAIQNKIEPLKTRLLSDENNSVLEESIKRGELVEEQEAIDKNINKGVTKQNKIQAPAKPTDPKINKDLNMSKDTETLDLEKDFLKLTEQKKYEQETTTNLANALAGGSSINRQSGTPDLIPSIRDGEITLLNTKASKYAVFVRRVATQVFNNLKSESWSSLTYNEISKIKNTAVIEAILDNNGKLKKISLKEDSNSIFFNNALEKSVNKGANDPHPPASALTANNEFIFIFQAKILSQLGTSPNGVPSERRWLILRVGLL